MGMAGEESSMSGDRRKDIVEHLSEDRTILADSGTPMIPISNDRW